MKPEGEAMHRCPNRACPSRGLETLIHWVMAAMDIEGVGEQFVRRFWKEGLLRSMPDLYRLTAEQLMEHEGFGEISAGKAIESIERSKEQPFMRVLFGLNIPQVGWVTAQNLARHFGAVDPLMEATQEEIQAVEGIGPDRAEAIAEWFSDEENRRLVAELRELGPHLRGGRGGAARRGPPDREDLRAHGHARALDARGGGGGARGEGREGRQLGLGQDGRGHRRRGARLEAREGPAGRGRAPRRRRTSRR